MLRDQREVILAQLTPASGYWLLAAGLVSLGAGMGLAMTPATSNIVSALPASQQPPSRSPRSCATTARHSPPPPRTGQNQAGLPADRQR